MMLSGRLDFGYQQQTQQPVNYVSVFGQLTLILEKWLHKYLGVRMEVIAKHINKLKGQHKVQAFEAWTHCLMEYGPSPFLSIRFCYHTDKNSLSEILEMLIVHSAGIW